MVRLRGPEWPGSAAPATIGVYVAASFQIKKRLQRETFKSPLLKRPQSLQVMRFSKEEDGRREGGSEVGEGGGEKKKLNLE